MSPPHRPPRAAGFSISRCVNATFTGTGAILARGVVKRVLLASPRGYCAGVERAVDTVERALRLYGEPVYVRKQIVHNSHVVRELEERGAIFVDAIDEIPEGRRSSSPPTACRPPCVRPPTRDGSRRSTRRARS